MIQSVPDARVALGVPWGVCCAWWGDPDLRRSPPFSVDAPGWLPEGVFSKPVCPAVPGVVPHIA